MNFGSNRLAYQLGLPTVFAWGQSYRDTRLTSLEVLPTVTFYNANGTSAASSPVSYTIVPGSSAFQYLPALSSLPSGTYLCASGKKRREGMTAPLPGVSLLRPVGRCVITAPPPQPR